MNDEKKYTERDVVERERRAFLNGIVALHLQKEIPSGPSVGRAVDRARAMTNRTYPLPTVARPRVVRDGHGLEWKWEYGQLWMRQTPASVWLCASPPMISEGARLPLADLLANPTEEVDDV